MQKKKNILWCFCTEEGITGYENICYHNILLYNTIITIHVTFPVAFLFLFDNRTLPDYRNVSMSMRSHAAAQLVGAARCPTLPVQHPTLDLGCAVLYYVCVCTPN